MSASTPPSRLLGPYLLGLVTVTGAVVLALEVLGTRVIGTYYGSSLYVWAALLVVTLVCLAFGYAVGGRLADRWPHTSALCALVMLAGASVLLVPALSGVLAPLDRALGLTGGAIASALVIFFLPLTLLAMAGPYVIRLRARHVDRVGATSGGVYAVSTIGSVLGVLMVSLWMIPALGTRISLLVCSALLIAAGAAGLVLVARGRGAPAILLAAAPLLLAARGGDALPGQLYHTESPFGDLRVLQCDIPERGPYRLLLVNGIMQTGMPLDIDLVSRGSILRSDAYYLELLPYFHPDLGAGRRGILIGLAGGMFARVMDFYDIDWTAVEIDVKLAELAKAYFGYRGDIHAGGRIHPVDLGRFPNRASPVMAEHERTGDGQEPSHQHAPTHAYKGRAIIQDGRQYLASHPAPVDFIVLDAYSSDTIPFHLVTREMFELIRSRLTDDGILAINYIGRPQDDFVTDSILRTLGEVFGPDRLRAYRSRDDASMVQVMTLFAFRRPMELTPLWQEGTLAEGVDRLSYELSTRQLNAHRPRGAIITDDHNPLDLARTRTALEWRRQTMALLSQRLGASNR